MNRLVLTSHPKPRTAVLAVVVFLLIAPILTAFSIEARAQGGQLSLADILIALRSKKVTLTDRNRILAEAINARGTTFTLTPEIEKELTGGGADAGLINMIRHRTQLAKGIGPSPSEAKAKPAETKPKFEASKPEPVVVAPPPPVQDFAFFEKRGGEAVVKGDLDAALLDYTKAIEMNESAVPVRMARGNVYVAKKSYVLAIADFTKVIELEPKNASAFARRADAHEKQGEAALALEDYKKTFDLDPTIESAKAAVEKFNAEQAKLAKPEPPPVVAPPVVLPEFLDLGQINESRAIKMIKPVYPQTASRAGVGGQVVVDIEMDLEGNVTKAKAVSGSAFLKQTSEEAALKSKFKPAMVGEKAVKGRAKIVYNFVAGR
jgi:TonB family protein